MAEEKKYYVMCQSNCKYESMTKEQILTAITQAVETGEIRDVDAGFITTVQTIGGTPMRFFYGEQSAYEALTDADKENLCAIITNDTFKESVEANLADLLAYKQALTSGTQYVAKANSATSANWASQAAYATQAGSATNADNATNATNATHDGAGNEISETYGNFEGTYTVQNSGYTLPTQGYYHFRAVIYTTTTVDFGIVEWCGLQVSKFMPWFGSGIFTLWELQITARGECIVRKYDDGSVTTEEKLLHIRQIKAH